MTKQVMEQALEALEDVMMHDPILLTATGIKADAAIAALKEAIKQAGEPAGWLDIDYVFYQTLDEARQDRALNPVALYTSFPTIPEDWRLVPEEPTDDMAAEGKLVNFGMHSERKVYRAMLAAAPSYQGDKP